jgi:phosphoglycerate dehydrogenase-like enzyme
MKVLIGGLGEPEEYAGLTQAGHELIDGRGLRGEQLLALYEDLDGAISGSVTGAQMERAKRLRAVISPVIGAERLDQDTATRLGIVACNSPSPENFHGVAEATVGLIITLNKRLKRKEARLRAGEWADPNRPHMLMGQTVGFVGFGRIARETARRLAGWDLHFLAYDPYVTPESASEFGVEMVDLPRLLSESDFVSVHVVATPETFEMIGDEQLRLMKPTAYLINTSRGQALNEDAFCRAVIEDRIAGGALDVFHQEPLGLESPLRDLDPERVILTPHSIAHTVESRAGGIRMAVDNMLRALRGEVPENVLNPEVIPAWRERFALVKS